MMIPEYFGTAAKAGPSHVVLWFLAIVALFVPLALVVSQLNRLIPLEGGLYEWARIAFNDRIGIRPALWLGLLLVLASLSRC
jgi:amino acid transporter